MPFSAKNRSDIIENFTNTHFDVLIIGGGITGAGISLDATARGLKVALVEMQDFAGGTSSRSTKLIHGGLRYLKQLEFKLVAEVGKERAIVHENAPHLAKPEPMLLPIVRGGSLGLFSSKIGMWVYEKLAGVKKEEWHKVLSVSETIATEPLLQTDKLLGGIRFYEYRTDDARLTIEVLKEAAERGAKVLNYSKVLSFLYKEDKICGAVVQCQLTGKEYSINADYVVNATGPWVDDMDDLDVAHMEHKLHITKGVHIVVDKKRLPVKQSVYFDTHDKRMLFVIPRTGKTYIGTTDTFYEGDIVHPLITKEDRDYLLDCVNLVFKDVNLTENDVESGWAGLRPLIHMPGKGPSEISRKDELFESKSGLITIAGGKLTGYRKMAQRVLDRIDRKIKLNTGKQIGACVTDKTPLSGGKVGGADKFDAFVAKKIEEGISLGLTANAVEVLVNRYGSNIDKLFVIVHQLITEGQHTLPLLLRAQLHYCIEEEMCVTPSDFFIRRTGSLYFDIETVHHWKGALLLYMRSLLSWSDELTARFELELEKAIKETTVST